MAAYENEGYCPSNSFGMYYPDQRNPLADDILKIAGSRIGYMVYEKRACAWNREWSSIVDAMLGGTGILGMEIACYLRALAPVCKYGESELKILISDQVSPGAISDDIAHVEENGKYKWGFFVNGLCGCDNMVTYCDDKTIFYDDRYLVVINSSDAVAHQTIYIDILKLS